MFQRVLNMHAYAGIKMYDVLTHINETPLQGYTIENAIAAIRCTVGDCVSLGVKRAIH